MTAEEMKEAIKSARKKTWTSVKGAYGALPLEKRLKWGVIIAAVAIISVAFFRDPGEPEKRKGGGISDPGNISPGAEVSIPALDSLNQKMIAGLSAFKHPGRGAGVKLPGPALIARPRTIKIPPGSIVKATLLSGASNGVVRARITEALSVNGERLIQSDWTLVGEGHSTEDRLFINFSQMVTKDSEVVSVSAQAIDGSDQTVGLKGSKVSHYATRFATGAGLMFLAGMAQGLQDQSVQMGVAVNKPSVKNALLQGTQNAAVQESQFHLERLKNEAPRIEVPVSTEISVMFLGDGS